MVALKLGVTNLCMAKSVAEFLTELMRQRSFSTLDLASLATDDRGNPMNRQTVWRHASGETEPSAVDRARYAKAFGMTLREFDELWQSPDDTAAAEAARLSLADLLRRADEKDLRDVLAALPPLRREQIKQLLRDTAPRLPALPADPADGLHQRKHAARKHPDRPRKKS